MCMKHIDHIMDYYAFCYLLAIYELPYHYGIICILNIFNKKNNAHAILLKFLCLTYLSKAAIKFPFMDLLFS